MSRRRSSPTGSSSAASSSASASSCSVSRSRPSSACFASASFALRIRSMARFFAAVMSQAPGLSGMPAFGHCSSALSRASWASSSAWLISRVKRVRPAMSFACSIRHTASIARCASGMVMMSDHIIFASMPQGQYRHHCQPSRVRARDLNREPGFVISLPVSGLARRHVPPEP